jgi:outer membrane immunogenic protein
MLRTVSALVGAASLIAVSGASAADIPQPTYRAPALVAPTLSWTGFYIGGNAGYAWSDQTLTVSGAASSGSIKSTLNGFIGGGQIGYNWQAPNNFVFGVEADIQGSSAKDTSTGTLTILGVAVSTTSTSKLDYLGTVRGRMGYSYYGSWMLYFTGGWAYGGANSTVTGTGGGVSVIATGSRSRTDGWTLGGGVEWMLSPNWIAGVEYLYVNFSGNSATTAGVTFSTNDLTANIVRGRISYKF